MNDKKTFADKVLIRTKKDAESSYRYSDLRRKFRDRECEIPDCVSEADPWSPVTG